MSAQCMRRTNAFTVVRVDKMAMWPFAKLLWTVVYGQVIVSQLSDSDSECSSDVCRSQLQAKMTVTVSMLASMLGRRCSEFCHRYWVRWQFSGKLYQCRKHAVKARLAFSHGGVLAVLRLLRFWVDFVIAVWPLHATIILFVTMTKLLNILSDFFTSW